MPGMPLDVEIFYPYWQETWNFIFWVPSIENLLVATKIEKNRKYIHIPRLNFPNELWLAGFC